MATDRDIRAAVYAELVTDQLIDADDIEVEVTSGVVSLTGTVPAQAQISEATAAARRADGVNRVDTLLAVAMPGDGFGDNEALAQSANRALAANGAVPASVRASARNGHVYLTGAVSHSTQRVAAENQVAAVAGVLTITNKIKVQGWA